MRIAPSAWDVLVLSAKQLTGAEILIENRRWGGKTAAGVNGGNGASTLGWAKMSLIETQNGCLA